MIEFFNHERISKPVINFNDIIKYVLHPSNYWFYL